MNENQHDIRIYVACLAAYNSGTLHGVWIDALQDVADIWAEIATMLQASPIEDAEEHAIHDYEGFGDVRLSEYAAIESVAEIATFIEEHGELGGKLISYCGDVDRAGEAITDHYAGEYRSLAEFAEQITDETTDIPENLRFYIDYEAMARDLEINDVFTIQIGFEEVHVFWSH